LDRLELDPNTIVWVDISFSRAVGGVHSPASLQESTCRAGSTARYWQAEEVLAGDGADVACGS